MASIYKRRKGKNEPYSIQYVDHLGKRKTAKGFTDKGLTEQLAGKLETEARLRRTGMIDADQERLATTKQAALDGLLDSFENSLADNSPKYVKLTMSQVRRVVTGAAFKTLADIDPETVQAFLRGLRKSDDMGHRTYNQYLQAMGTFCNWCVATKRLPSNPLAGIERLNTAVDVRHARRALTAEEVAQLVDSARSSGVRIQGYTGEQRARIYLVSFLTGVRRNELASLTRRSFSLDAVPPTITVEATYSKHRRKDVLPLHPELAAMLRVWTKWMEPGEKLFPMLARRKTWRMVKKDLERVGIPYETDDGIADFHAAGRHTHITELLRNGASLAEAKELARHSDIKTTMKYTHIGLKDQARAVAAIPAPQQRKAPIAKVSSDNALHGRCISGVSEGQRMASSGAEGDAAKRQNPCESKGFGVVCHRVSLGDPIGATGFEPGVDFDASADGQCDCNLCQGDRALASLSTDLRRVITVWDSMSDGMRAAIIALTGTEVEMEDLVAKRQPGSRSGFRVKLHHREAPAFFLVASEFADHAIKPTLDAARQQEVVLMDCEHPSPCHHAVIKPISKVMGLGRPEGRDQLN